MLYPNEKGTSLSLSTHSSLHLNLIVRTTSKPIHTPASDGATHRMLDTFPLQLLPLNFTLEWEEDLLHHA
ncbi:hypothetical protein Hypma_016594 [Hypsizygus marmoreus]|uniref:Uncharacterized protein n=1 Tax=Hypsizygus marmoreus TaxID=39966 RepID=A0A369J388_HYPMA|nr:hypothetical protein Hypma_016594 [Hypsizygus marmoreus]